MKALIFLSFFLCLTLAGRAESQWKSAESFGQDYRNADTPEKRMSLCIEAINQNMISSDTSWDNLQEMFGLGLDDWGRKRFESVSKGVFVIHFQDFGGNYRAPDGAPSTGEWKGWYLYIKLGPNNHGVQIHFLSNLWTFRKGLVREVN
jgi:hypothetical protein